MVVLTVVTVIWKRSKTDPIPGLNSHDSVVVVMMVLLLLWMLLYFERVVAMVCIAKPVETIWVIRMVVVVVEVVVARSHLQILRHCHDHCCLL